MSHFVVKFADGSYLSPNGTYGSRVMSNRHALKLPTRGMARTVAHQFDGAKARVVRVRRKAPR